LTRKAGNLVIREAKDKTDIFSGACVLNFEKTYSLLFRLLYILNLAKSIFVKFNQIYTIVETLFSTQGAE
jgi:hypothetical protein